MGIRESDLALAFAHEAMLAARDGPFPPEGSKALDQFRNSDLFGEGSSHPIRPIKS